MPASWWPLRACASEHKRWEVTRQRPTTERLELETSLMECPFVALCDPTYSENSHANHTLGRHAHQIARFKASEVQPVWVRFPSPAPSLLVGHRPQSWSFGFQQTFCLEVLRRRCQPIVRRRDAPESKQRTPENTVARRSATALDGSSAPPTIASNRMTGAGSPARLNAE